MELENNVSVQFLDDDCCRTLRKSLVQGQYRFEAEKTQTEGGFQLRVQDSHTPGSEVVLNTGGSEEAFHLCLVDSRDTCCAESTRVRQFRLGSGDSVTFEVATNHAADLKVTSDVQETEFYQNESHVLRPMRGG